PADRKARELARLPKGIAPRQAAPAGATLRALVCNFALACLARRAVFTRGNKLPIGEGAAEGVLFLTAKGGRFRMSRGLWITALSRAVPGPLCCGKEEQDLPIPSRAAHSTRMPESNLLCFVRGQTQG